LDRQDNHGRLAIVAGSGGLPLHVAHAARRRSDEPYIFAIKGESTVDWSDFDHVDLSIGDIAGFKRISSEKRIDRIVLSGGVRVRPAWNEFRLNLGTIWRLPKLMSTLMRGGDNLVLTTAIGLLEGEGRRVIGAQDIAPGLVAELGPLGKHAPDRQAEIDIRISLKAARLLGELDIGQGVIAVGGRVVALEGPEGTDSMIGRINELRTRERISQKRPGVLVKLCKPSQDLRVDLPSAGLSTIRNARDAGLSGIALEAGRSLILDRQEVLDFADSHGMFVIGIDPDAYGVAR